MRIEFVSNTSKKVLKYILEMLEWGDEVDIAVAYLKESGFAKIKNELINKKIRFLLGFDFFLTDVSPLRELIKEEKVLCKIYKTSLDSDEKSYHPKIYIAKKRHMVKILMGSSNLTDGGFYSNVEGNVYIEGEETEILLREILDFFEEKWNSAVAIDLTMEIINIYEHNKEIYEKKVNSNREPIIYDNNPLFTMNAVIVCMTKEHDYNDIYNRLIGIPIRAKKIAFEHIHIDTRLFIYYKGIGIKKVVLAMSKPYIDYSIIKEWEDGLPEKYPIRVKTKLFGMSNKFISFKDLKKLGVSRVDTGHEIVPFHLQNSLIPISNNDADSIQNILGL